MKTTSIQIPSQTIYLSEALNNTLPKNCLFNKGKVGAGGTTIALISEEDYIIAVPYVALIQNKITQSIGDSFYPHKILGVYGETSQAEIENYMKSNHVKKIMVTYDSLPKVAEVVGFDMNLLIDEYHLLFKHSVFRAKAVRYILDNFSRFKSHCFMTVTELEDAFILEELKELDRTIAVWENSLEVTVKPVIAMNSVLSLAIIYEIINESVNTQKMIEVTLKDVLNAIKAAETGNPKQDSKTIGTIMYLHNDEGWLDEKISSKAGIPLATVTRIINNNKP